MIIMLRLYGIYYKLLLCGLSCKFICAFFDKWENYIEIHIGYGIWYQLQHVGFLLTLIFSTVDTYKCKLGYDEQNECYFFSHKDKKYPTGTRTNKATTTRF